MAAMIFLSDAHLPPHWGQEQQLFCTHLATLSQQADAIYILGDLFEYWIGDEHLHDMSDFVDHCQAICTHTPIYFLPGNRDFLLGQLFFKSTGIQLLLDEHTLLRDGHQHFMLCHGDTLCQNDRSYQRLRKLVRHPLVRTCFLMLPWRWRDQLAKYLRQQSRQRTQMKVPQSMQPCMSTLANEAQQANCTWLIHGHIHRYQHFTLLQHPSTQVISLPCWELDQSCLLFNNQLEYVLMTA